MPASCWRVGLDITTSGRLAQHCTRASTASCHHGSNTTNSSVPTSVTLLCRCTGHRLPFFARRLQRRRQGRQLVDLAFAVLHQRTYCIAAAHRRAEEAETTPVRPTARPGCRCRSTWGCRDGGLPCRDQSILLRARESPLVQSKTKFKPTSFRLEGQAPVANRSLTCFRCGGPRR